MPNKSQSILLSGSAIGVAGVMAGLIPVAGGCLACVLYVVAGVGAVWHYTDRHQLTIKGGQGLSLGALAALVASAIQMILNMLFEAIGIKPGWREEARRQLEDSGMDPAQMDQMLELFSSPFAYVGMILIGLVVAVILGGIGGAIGANVFKREPSFFEGGIDSDASSS